MPKKTKHIENLEEVDTLAEHRELVKEITATIKAVGKDARIELTGDRTYDVEADGSIYLVHGGQRRPVSRWRASDEWQYFREDVEINGLMKRLEALKDQD